LLAPLVLTACQPALLDPQGPVGTAQKTILIDSLAIMLAIVLPTIAATAVFAWWFRASNTRATHLPNWEFSGRIEMIVWSIPALTVMLLGGVTWIGSHDLDPGKPLPSSRAPLDVQVVSMDWKWLFIYPAEGVASVNRLAIPVDRPVRFTLTSASVMNAFFIPQLGTMIYTMNGMATRLNLQADTPGTLRGLSSQFSGDGFPGMHFEVLALPEQAFATWIDKASRDGKILDSTAYKDLAQQSVNVAPFTFRATEPGIFDQVVSRVLPPGPGPSPGPGREQILPRPSHSPQRGM
jgi:cytochrome o ubiquinol oxidase subunit 2